MNTNPYEPPQEKSNEKPEIHASAAALRVVVIVQLLSIALVGSWARGFVSVSPVLERWGVATLILASLYGGPALAIGRGLRANLSRMQFVLLIAVETGLTLLYLLALLPAVQ
jgi:hypothetical protein